MTLSCPHNSSPQLCFLVSHTIQNDLISALAATISDQIRDEIQDAPFFGWQVDETTDISCRAQLSLIVRRAEFTYK